MTKSRSATKYEPVDASPVKSFFVKMLTRDIALTDAILDLLDNCVDGILRKKNGVNGDRPYEGFRAYLAFDKDTFSICDNCGGIPWRLKDYAFRLGQAPGREEKLLGTVGTYGIGMKRAIFKMGRQCLITTRNDKDNYEVDLMPEWIDNEDDWAIPVRSASKSMEEDGTNIVIGNLYPGIAAQFGHDKAAFETDLTNKISSHYAFIIDKGFNVTVNGTSIKPKPTRLVFAESFDEGKAIRPYIFRTETNGVKVFLSVGFTRPIPSQEEVQSELEERKWSSMDAGWTVLCNDRAVLYCDKTEQTGWGEASVPQYHTQFIAISGIVEFVSDDPSKLPTTTTKRGIDASSALYLQVKNRMREGMQIFTNYTNSTPTDK